MALQVNITSPHGLPLPTCYVRIESFTGTKDGVSMVVGYYVDASSREAGKDALWTSAFQADELLNGASLAQMYTTLKTSPPLTAALDV